MTMRLVLLLSAISVFLPRHPCYAQSAATRAVYLDKDGVIRWQDNKAEVRLFGANYTLPSASDYRAAGYLHLDRHKLVDEDMAHFQRMGWDGLRLSFWGDWENADSLGNLVVNDHLDLQDYVIAKAREHGIYILLSPITTYNAGWPDALGDTSMHGFSRYYDRGKLGTDPKALAAQTNYLKQILEHVNPYTHVALKDEPSILFIEPVNEPWHHPENLTLSVNYINALTDAIRSTGCNKLVFYNVSQDFKIAQAIRQSKAQGVTFGWYPTGLNSGHELQGNYLRGVDSYDSMLTPQLARLPRIVYEFDAPDTRTGYMYPAMARAFRAVGAQFAAMFAYDMLETASRNLGWQTHYLNLVYTPRKAMSAVIAAAAMHRLPRLQSYGGYPVNTHFGDFHVSYEQNLGELVANDAFMYAGNTTSMPPHPEQLTHIAGYGSSPVVQYDGEGVYFLDKVKAGEWRLEVYPDAVPVRDPFEMPNAQKIVTRAIYRSWPMRITLPDLGTLAFDATPGLYQLVRGAQTKFANPAARGMYLPAADTSDFADVTAMSPMEFVSHRPITVSARVVSETWPDSVILFVRPGGRGFFRHYAMHRTMGYEYGAAITDTLPTGPYDYAIAAWRHDSVTTYPEKLHNSPASWDWSGSSFWHFSIVDATTPLRLFTAADAARMSFSRIGDAGRTGLYRVVPSDATGQMVFHFERPAANGWSPEDYTGNLIIKDRVAARGAAITSASALRIRLRSIAAAGTVHVTLVEKDGAAWSADVAADSAWSEKTIPLGDFKPSNWVKLPEGFPGEWNYWASAPADRAGSSMRLTDVERLQFSLRGDAGRGVEIETVSLVSSH